MTNEEALQYFKEIEFIDKWGPDEAGNGDPLIKQADEARLAAIEALEKQVPKKLGKADFGNHKNFFDKCPNCGYEAAGSHFKYCHECGQRLDWGDNHDT